jgi:hypothetical protein
MALITKKKATSSKLPSIVVAVILAVVVLLVVNSTDNSHYDLPPSLLSSTILVAAAANTNTTRNWIWDQLNPQEQVLAMKDARQYLEAFVSILNKTKQDMWVSQERCEVELFGSQWGTHQLCKQDPPPQDCAFVSFGISVDYSFDTELAERWKCHGFSADPTIVHKSQLHDLVSFHNIAAKTLRTNEEARSAKRPWWVASVPAVKRFLGLKHINVLKMDCEGCGKCVCVC